MIVFCHQIWKWPEWKLRVETLIALGVREQQSKKLIRLLLVQVVLVWGGPADVKVENVLPGVDADLASPPWNVIVDVLVMGIVLNLIVIESRFQFEGKGWWILMKFFLRTQFNWCSANFRSQEIICNALPGDDNSQFCTIPNFARERWKYGIVQQW
jgi:hypothetical protein